jgi:hypothetical protein
MTWMREKPGQLTGHDQAVHLLAGASYAEPEVGVHSLLSTRKGVLEKAHLRLED